LIRDAHYLVDVFIAEAHHDGIRVAINYVGIIRVAIADSIPKKKEIVNYRSTRNIQSVREDGETKEMMGFHVKNRKCKKIS
jgi:hypothetical protein